MTSQRTEHQRTEHQLTQREIAELSAANASAATPVVFVHGLWMLASSWELWRTEFAAQGFATLAAEWPGDAPDVESGRQHPETFARVGVQAITDRVAEFIRGLHRPPIVIGHSFGGLVAQKLAGMGLARATVAIDPGPFRGVLPLPLSALRVASAVVANPRNWNRSVMLSREQFRYGFGNAVSAAESDALYERYSVPGSGRPLFQAATGNLNPRSETRVDTRTAERGPLLLVSGDEDHTAPPAMSRAAFRIQRANAAPTELRELRGLGHSLVIDRHWAEVAGVALDFIRRVAS